MDRVISSKFYRAYEAAKLLDAAEITTSIDVTEGGLVVCPNENDLDNSWVCSPQPERTR